MKTKIKTNGRHSILERLRELDGEPGTDTIAGVSLFDIRRVILAKLRLRTAKQRHYRNSISPV